MQGLIQAQNTRIQSLENDKKRSKVEKFVEGLVSNGQITGTNINKVTDLLLKVDGIERFAEGESTMDLVMRTLQDSLPKQDVRRTPVSGGAARFDDGGPENDRIAKEYETYKEMLESTGQPVPTAEKFCEWNSYEVPESIKTPADNKDTK